MNRTNTQSSASLSGSQALSKLFKRSRDQVVRSVKARYTGKRAPTNIAKDIKTIMSLMNVENKVVYTTPVAQTVTYASPLVYGLSTTAQGSASNNRTGDSIKVDRIDLLLQFDFSSGTLATNTRQSQLFNWYLVRYLKTPSTGGTASFAIAEFLNPDGNAGYSTLSFPNSDTNQNFNILANGAMYIELPYAATSSATVSKTVSFCQECNFHQTYSGSGTSNITDNMVYLVFTAMANPNAGGVSNVTAQAAMWYIDN